MDMYADVLRWSPRVAYKRLCMSRVFSCVECLWVRSPLDEDAGVGRLDVGLGCLGEWA